jgi:hypothetical protein
LASTSVPTRYEAGSDPLRNAGDLLRRHEPIAAFTQGEMFFPMGVERYLAGCSLTQLDERGGFDVLADGLSPQRLAELGHADRSGRLALRFVETPLGGAEYRHWDAERPAFEAQGRLARVGLIGRFTDAIYRLTFLLRGRVPGGTAAAAEVEYRSEQAEDPEFVYHGRVFWGGGYVVLNYQFFFAMNDWRSSFYGANDHEADWEQVFVYLAEMPDGSLEPAWVAYASHDFYGADLRRRWDDPDLTIIDGHPVVFTAAGSHASYFQAGDYVTAVDIKILQPISALSQLIRRFWRDTLGQGDPTSLVQGIDELFRVPFVDYARGDGLRIGHGEAQGWTPVVIDDGVDWVDGYRGLWGLDTRDVFAGERAPAGPKYNRDGSVRQSWYDPIGWAGLDQEPLAGLAEAELARRIQSLRDEAAEMSGRIAAASEQLPEVALEASALEKTPLAQGLRRQRQGEVQELQADLTKLKADQAELCEAAFACEKLLERIRAGYRPGPRDHIRHYQQPESSQSFHEGRIAELWAAASIGLLFMLGAGLLLVGAPWFTALFFLIGGSMLVDAILRGTVVHALLNTTIVLAVITTGILVYETFWGLVLLSLLALGVLLLINNLRELRGS